jgi:hypothetical protein
MKSHCALLTGSLLGAAIPANASIGTSDGTPQAGATTDQSYIQLARMGGGGGGIRAGGCAHVSAGGSGGGIRGGSSASLNHTANINIHNGNNSYAGGGNYYHGGGGHYYDHWDDHYYHPVAAGIAIGTAAAVTAAVVGSVVYSVPSTCGTVIVNGFSYYQCGSLWCRPQYAGSSVQYVVVTAPR